LKATGIEAFWVGTSFLLSSTVFQPAFTSLSHLFGRKLLLLAALCFFTVGAVVAGCAHDVPDLLVGRSIQGVGGAGIVVLTSVLMTDLFALRERGKWGGFINLLWAIGSVAGPPIGGTLAQNGAWVGREMSISVLLADIIIKALDLLDQSPFLRPRIPPHSALPNTPTSVRVGIFEIAIIRLRGLYIVHRLRNCFPPRCYLGWSRIFLE
jgi:MFS family permease